MGKYNLMQDARDRAELANDKVLANAKGVIADKYVLGTRTINAEGKEMAEIEARFLANSANSLEDPAFDCIMWQINWDDKVGLFADEQYKGSAMYYLKQIGELDRAEQLKQVITILKGLFDITANYAPRNYFLKSVEGIGALNENYRKLGMPSELTLQCYDDITWKLRTVAMQLSYIYYDRERQLEVLPKNLRRFSCEFYISDIRDLRTPVETYKLHGIKQRKSLGDLVSQGLATAIEATTNWISGVDVQESAVPEWVSLYDANTFYNDSSNGVLDKYHVLITCPYATIYAEPFPDSVSNVEQTELSASLKLSIYDYDFVLMNHALQTMISVLSQKAINAEMERTVMVDGVPMKVKDAIAEGKIGKAVALTIWNAMREKVAGQVKAAAGKFCDNMIQYAKNKAASVLTTVTANVADQLGVNDIVQDIKQYTNPALLSANIDKWIDPFIDKVSGKVDYLAIAKSGYFTDKQTVQATNLPDKTYKTKLE